MTAFAESFAIGRSTEDRAVAYYAARRVPARFAGLPEAVLSYAYAVSDGDWRRCVRDATDPNAITIYNYVVWLPGAD